MKQHIVISIGMTIVPAVESRPGGQACVIPLALRGVAHRPLGAVRILRRNLLLYGAGGVVIPFFGIKPIDLLLHALRLA